MWRMKFDRTFAIIIAIQVMLLLPVNTRSDKSNRLKPEHNPFCDPSFAKYSLIPPHKLKALLQLEWHTYPSIKKLFHKYRDQTSGIKAEYFEKNVKKYLEDAEKLLGKTSGQFFQMGDSPWNPLIAYKIVSLFLDYLKVWAREKPSADSTLMTEVHSSLSRDYTISDEPTNHDLAVAMYGIWQMQHDYNLTAKDIASGVWNGMDANVALNAKDCFRIGNHSTSANYYTIGIEWLEHALYLVQNTSDDTVQYEDVEDVLLMSQVLGSDVDMKLWKVCNGEVHQTRKEISKLFCWYEHEVHPSFKISPIKAEFLSMFPKPELVQFHDVMDDETINLIQNSTYLSKNSHVKSVEFLPVRVGGSLVYANAITMKLLKFIKRLTGLETINTDVQFPIAVFAYPPGTDKERHVDAGNMALASFMFYLSDVELGGETGFATIGTKVTPRKGSAVFWYGRLMDGTFDYSSDHGSCPIIFGEKWVVFYPISLADQNPLRCHPNPKRKKFEILVNGNSKYRNRGPLKH